MAPLEATATMEKLTNLEKAAELVYEGMRRGMPREEFARRMSAQTS